jgi:hypothetical protein
MLFLNGTQKCKMVLKSNLQAHLLICNYVYHSTTKHILIRELFYSHTTIGHLYACPACYFLHAHKSPTLCP